jgi:hypothetical protein
VIGASPVLITGWLNVGPTSLATASGDFAAGDSASESQLHFDAASSVLSLLPVTATDNAALFVGIGSAASARGSIWIRSESATANDAEFRGLDGGSSGVGTELLFRSGSPTGTPGPGEGTQGGDVELFGADGGDDVSGGNGGGIDMRGGVAARFGGANQEGAIFTLGGATSSRGGHALLISGDGSDGFASGSKIAGTTNVFAGDAGPTGGGRGGDISILSGFATGAGTGGNVTFQSDSAGGANGDVTFGGTNAKEVNVTHSSGLLGFYGVAAVGQSAAYTRTATIVGSRVLASSASASPTNTNNVLAAVIQDLQALGLIGK